MLIGRTPDQQKKLYRRPNPIKHSGPACSSFSVPFPSSIPCLSVVKNSPTHSLFPVVPKIFLPQLAKKQTAYYNCLFPFPFFKYCITKKKISKYNHACQKTKKSLFSRLGMNLVHNNLRTHRLYKWTPFLLIGRTPDQQKKLCRRPNPIKHSDPACSSFSVPFPSSIPYLSVVKNPPRIRYFPL